jgi:hypothetical protein
MHWGMPVLGGGLIERVEQKPVHVSPGRPKENRTLFRHRSVGPSRSAFLGNPARYSTFIDESLNKALRVTAATANRAKFQQTIFTCFAVMARVGCGHLFFPESDRVLPEESGGESSGDTCSDN